MSKYFFIFLLLLFYFNTIVSQNDSLPNKGTIKVSKGKKELYIKAAASFKMYRPTTPNYDYSWKAFAMNAAGPTPVIRAIEPEPVVFNYNEEFNYTSYFRNNPGLRAISIGDKTSDTVRIEIDVFTDGQHRYYHTKPQKTITMSVSKGEKASDKYIFSEAQIATMLVLEGVNNWQPAYHIVTEKSKKKSKKPKQKKEILNATGLITVAFSTTPFSEEE